MQLLLDNMEQKYDMKKIINHEVKDISKLYQRGKGKLMTLEKSKYVQ